MNDGKFKRGDPRINRVGRPPATETEFRHRLRRKLLEIGPDGKRRVDRLIDSMLDAADKGDREARKTVLNYAYGQPASFSEASLVLAMDRRDPDVGRLLAEAVNGEPLPAEAEVETAGPLDIDFTSAI